MDGVIEREFARRESGMCELLCGLTRGMREGGGEAVASLHALVSGGRRVSYHFVCGFVRVVGPTAGPVSAVGLVEVLVRVPEWGMVRSGVLQRLVVGLACEFSALVMLAWAACGRLVVDRAWGRGVCSCNAPVVLC